MRPRKPSTPLLTLLASLLLLAACEQPLELLPPAERGTEEGPVLRQQEVETQLKDGVRQPLDMLVQATEPGPAKQTRTLEEARAELAADELTPLREALEAGGWDAEQSAQMVYFAGTHQSGAPEDSIRHRQQKIHDELSLKLDDFRTTLDQASQEEGMRIKWDELNKAGVVTTLSTKVIQ